MAMKSRYALPIIKMLADLKPGEKLKLIDIIKFSLLKDGWRLKESDFQFGLSDFLFKRYKNKTLGIMRMIFDPSNINEKYIRGKDKEGFYWIKK